MFEDFFGVLFGSVKWDFLNGILKFIVSRFLVNNIYICCLNYIGYFEIKCICSVLNVINYKLM